jgi:hypothetical protein
MEGRPARLPVGPARPDLAEKRPDEGVVVRVEGGRVELVALEAEAGDRGRARVGAGRRPAEAEDRPATGRDVPRQAPLGRELVREVDDPGRIDGRAFGDRREYGGRREERLDARL